MNVTPPHRRRDTAAPANRPAMLRATSRSPKQAARNAAPFANSVGRSLGAAAQAIHQLRASCKVTSGKFESDLAPIRTAENGTAWHSSHQVAASRGAYDSAGLPDPLGMSGGDAASRVQAVAPMATAPITAKTCRQRSDVMVSPERPKVA